MDLVLPLSSHPPTYIPPINHLVSDAVWPYHTFRLFVVIFVLVESVPFWDPLSIQYQSRGRGRDSLSIRTVRSKNLIFWNIPRSRSLIDVAVLFAFFNDKVAAEAEEVGRGEVKYWTDPSYWEDDDNNKDNNDEDYRTGGKDHDLCIACTIRAAYPATGTINTEAAQLCTRGSGIRRALHTPPPPWFLTQKMISVLVIRRRVGVRPVQGR